MVPEKSSTISPVPLYRGSTTSNFTVYILFQKCALLIANVLTFYWLNCKSRDNDIKAPNGLDWSGLEVNPGPDQKKFSDWFGPG